MRTLDARSLPRRLLKSPFFEAADRIIYPMELSPSCWLRAHDLALNDGDGVATWPDASGNGNNFTQGTALNRPTFETNEINGFPIVRFPQAVSNGMTSSLTYSSGSFSIVVLAKYNGVASAQQRLVQGTNNWLIGPYSAQWTFFNGSVFLATSPGSQIGAIGAGYVVHAMAETIGSSSNMMTEASVLRSAASGSAPGALHLSAGGGFTNEPANSDLAEVIITSTHLTTAQLRGLTYYLWEKYDLGLA